MRGRVIAIAFTAALACLGGTGYPTLVARAAAKARYRANPFAGQERALMAGRKLYRRECAGCHGEQAQGRGSAPPLKQPEIRYAAPAALEWILRNGSLHRGMPSFAHLPEPQRWQIVTYLKSL